MCLSCWWLPGGWQRDMPRVPLGSWLPPAWGCFASQAWEVSSVLSSFHCYLYKSAAKTHSREVLWKWWETLQQSPDFQASWRCAQRHTHTHTPLLHHQAGSAALLFHYCLCPPPHPCVWCPEKGNYPVHFPQRIPTGSGNTSPDGQCLMANNILNLALEM